MNLSSVTAQLLSRDDPVELLFQAVNEIWIPDTSGNLDAFYTEQERETNRLEEYIRDTYFEMYDALLEQIKTHDRAAEFASANHVAGRIRSATHVTEVISVEFHFSLQSRNYIPYTSVQLLVETTYNPKQWRVVVYCLTPY